MRHQAAITGSHKKQPNEEGAKGMIGLSHRSWTRFQPPWRSHAASLAVQRQLGADRPDFGVLFADIAAGEGLSIAPSRLMQPKIEAEVVLVLARDLSHPDATVADLLAAAASVLPAPRIVGSRLRG